MTITIEAICKACAAGVHDDVLLPGEACDCPHHHPSEAEVTEEGVNDEKS